MGLSLWIVPNEANSKELESIMHIKTRDAGLSAASYPIFHPHITLASLPPQFLSKFDEIRAAIPLQAEPLRCSFASVDIGEVYFRSVYITIKPTLDILEMHKSVHKNLAVESKTPSFPHLSLCYIDDVDGKKGERTVYYDLIKQQGRIKEVGHDGEPVEKEVSLRSESNHWTTFFDAEEIWLVNCEGPVEDWKVLRKFPFVEHSREEKH